jgi:hypothetical protein
MCCESLPGLTCQGDAVQAARHDQVGEEQVDIHAVLLEDLQSFGPR